MSEFKSLNPVHIVNHPQFRDESIVWVISEIVSDGKLAIVYYKTITAMVPVENLKRA